MSTNITSDESFIHNFNQSKYLLYHSLVFFKDYQKVLLVLLTLPDPAWRTNMLSKYFILEYSTFYRFFTAGFWFGQKFFAICTFFVVYFFHGFLIDSYNCGMITRNLSVVEIKVNALVLPTVSFLGVFQAKNKPGIDNNWYSWTVLMLHQGLLLTSRVKLRRYCFLNIQYFKIFPS